MANEKSMAGLGAAKRKAAKAAKPRTAVLQANGVYGLGKCPRCAALPKGRYCAGCTAEMADGARLWG